MIRLQVLVDAFYAGTVDDQAFLAATKMTIDCFDAAAGGYYNKTNDSRELCDTVLVGVDQYWIDRWRELMKQSNSLGRWAHNPVVGAVVNIDRHLPVEADPAHEAWLKPQGFHYSTGVLVEIGVDALSAFILLRADGQDRFDEEDDMAIACLGRHITQVMFLRRKLRVLDGQLSVLSAMLDQLPTPAILVDRAARINQINKKAFKILQEQENLRDRNGQLRVNDPKTNEMLHRAINEAVEFKSMVSVVVRRAAARPLTLEINPISTIEGKGRAGSHLALALILDPSDITPSSAQQLRELYGLTAGEARVALAVLDHDRLQDIADSMGRSLGTIRSQLSLVLAKTGTSRQAELVKLLIAHGRRN